MAVDDNLLSVNVSPSVPVSVEVHYAAESLPVSLADDLSNLGVPIEHVKEPFGRARIRELRDKALAFHVD